MRTARITSSLFSQPQWTATHIRYNTQGLLLAKHPQVEYHARSDCYSYVRNKTLFKNIRQLQVFFETGLMKFCRNGFLDIFTQDLQRNQYVVIITDRYSNLTRTVPTRRITFSNVVYTFLDDWIIAYAIPKYILTANDTKFSSKRFATLSIQPGTQQIPTSAYHPQSHRQVKRINEAIVSSFRQYIAANQD